MAKFTRADIRRILGDACTDEIENQLIALHLGVVDPLKDDVARFKADAERLPVVQKELDDIKAAKNDGENTAQTELKRVKKEFDEYKAQITAEKTLDAKKAAYRAACKDILSDKGVEIAVKHADFGKIELGEDGKIKDKETLLKSVAEEWDDYVRKSGETGAQTATPPKGEPTTEKPTRAAEIAAQFRANNYGKKEG